jgi:heat shock protein HslJ
MRRSSFLTAATLSLLPVLQACAAQPSLELGSDGALHAAELSLGLGGEMTYLADAATFTECMTGRRHPIAMEGDYLAIERAYLAAVSEPGAPLYVTFDGTLAERPRMEGGGTERTVVVNRYINVWPGERCERAAADASLSNTYWRIVRLRSEAVAATDGRREPHLILREGDGRGDFKATVGCNGLEGSYRVDAEQVSFSAAAAATQPCPAPLDELERSLAEVLAATARWRIIANTLEFFDASGASLALLEAVYLR